MAQILVGQFSHIFFSFPVASVASGCTVISLLSNILEPAEPVWNVIFLCTAHLSPCFQLCTESLTGDSLVHTATLGRLGWGGVLY